MSSPYAYVLMTAMPPTWGHLDLIRFAAQLSGQVVVIVCTQPGEPYPRERVEAINDTTRSLGVVRVAHVHRTLPQEPEGHEGFWDLWAEILHSEGFEAGDYIVASETYGQTLAAHVDGRFMPYDLDRQIRYTKATDVRYDPVAYWDDMLPQFRRLFQKRVTLFGAESTGKTTTTRELARHYGARWIFEWWRPYAELVGPEVTVEKMHACWHGQSALQDAVGDGYDGRILFQDTDLFSTVGYWEMWQPESMPAGLLAAARARKSDLYLILSSDIPFAADPLRLGGDRRETTDQYWIDLCVREGLPYAVVSEVGYERELEALEILDKAIPEPVLSYQREGAEYVKEES